MIHKIIGVGAGPNNLSIFALTKKISREKFLILEKNDSIKWHQGMMIDNATLQNNIAKDLVTLADPTSEYSILNYLHEKKRIYEFISNNNRFYRREYEDYLRWVAGKLNNIKYDENVYNIKDKNGYYEIITDKDVYKAYNVCIAVGRQEYIPESFNGAVDNKIIFHSCNYLYNKETLKNKNILIVGGGQSAAEIFLDLTKGECIPKSIIWVSRRYNLLQINESCFDNYLYTPSYVSYFLNLDKEAKDFLLKYQKMTSDGINPETLDEVYAFLYKNKLINGDKIEVNFHMSSEVIFENITKDNVNVIVRSNITKSERTVTVDATILCTGYVQNKTPDILKELSSSSSNYDDFVYYNDYSVKKNENGKIYLINAGVNHFGVSDPNISLCAWRSSIIVNSIFGQEIYKTPQYMDSILC
ncbi:hypothetical protein FQW43_13685 [Salmonella enterica subsp. enterica serovar Enteritidis]|nr:hypothetical protein [Salmonella enterica subsp. enterica serovar Enteritidis]